MEQIETIASQVKADERLLLLFWALSEPMSVEQMAERGVSVRVVDMYSIKPIDRELIKQCAEETGAIVCAEEHNVRGGLGSAVSEVLAYFGCGVPTEFVGIQDTFTESAPYKELLAKYGVDANGVIAGIEKVLERK